MIYTRSESTGMNQFFTFKEAFDYAQKDPTIWKISFTQMDERTEKLEHIRCSRR